MRIKSYFSNSVETALNLARLELGEEAMLISVRNREPGSGNPGNYEVVIGTNQADLSDGTQGIQDRSNRRRSREQPKIADRSLTLRKSAVTAEPGAGTRTAAVQKQAEEPAGSRPAKWSERPQADSDRPSGSAAPGVSRISSISGSEGRKHRSVRFSTEPLHGRVAFVGAAGAGKTTTLMKTAFQIGLARNQQVRIISLDADRIGAAEPLRTFCIITQIPLCITATAKEFQVALADAGESALVLIDTPGFSPEEMGAASDIAAILQGNHVEQIQLVVSATMSAEALSLTERRFSFFRPTHVLYTKVDEVGSMDNVILHSRECGLPVSFVGSGRKAFDGLSEASESSLAATLIAQELGAIESAA